MASGRAAAAVALGLFALCSIAGGGSEAAASPVQLAFAGEVATSYSKLPGLGLGPVGSLVVGTITLDPDTLTGSGPGHYTWSASLSVGNVSPRGFTSSLGYLDITDGPSADSWGATTSHQPPQPPPGLNATFLLEDASGTALSSTDYFTPTSLAPWTSATLYIYFWDGQSVITWSQNVRLTDLSLAAAPEPAAAGLAGVALLLLLARRAFAR